MGGLGGGESTSYRSRLPGGHQSAEDNVVACARSTLRSEAVAYHLLAREREGIQNLVDASGRGRLERAEHRSRGRILCGPGLHIPSQRRTCSHRHHLDTERRKSLRRKVGAPAPHSSSGRREPRRPHHRDPRQVVRLVEQPPLARPARRPRRSDAGDVVAGHRGPVAVLVPCTEGQLVLSPVAPYDSAWAWEGLAHLPIRS